MNSELTRSQELTASGPDGCPQVGRQLLGVLMLQDELSDSALTQRTAGPHSSHPALLLYQLAVDQGHQLPLHGPTEHARAEGGHTCKRRAALRTASRSLESKGKILHNSFFLYCSRQSPHYLMQ